MKELPDPTTYEKENMFFPWGDLISLVKRTVVQSAPKNASLVDLACGPGFLLGAIARDRCDLRLKGVDLDRRYIEYAKEQHPMVSFVFDDILSWQPTHKYDVVTCTAGIHHLPYEQQERFIRRIPSMLATDGVFIAADPYIAEYFSEKERRRAAAQLGYKYLLASIDLNAPDDILKAAVDIMYNDVLGFEYKTSTARLRPVFESVFSSVEVIKTWPKEQSDFGEFCFVCRI